MTRYYVYFEAIIEVDADEIEGAIEQAKDLITIRDVYVSDVEQEDG